MAGYVGLGDPNGDFYSLGNVLAGTTLSLTLTQPSTSALGGVLNIYNASGTNLTNNTLATSSLSYTVPVGQGGAYFARVSAVSGTADVLSQYVLSIDVVNTTPPQIVGDTLPVAGSTATINVSTGLNSSGNLLNTSGALDANWTVDQPAGGTAAAQVVTSSSADWYSGWSADGPNSDWVAVNAATAVQPAAPYNFYRTFDLTGYNLFTVSLNATIYNDDSASVTLNGHQLYSSGNNYSGTFISVSGTSGDFNPGLNTLITTMTSSDRNLDAVRLDGSVTVTPNATTSVFNQFTLGFSESMAAATVNNTANYTLKDAQGNVYHLSNPNYSSGLSATYLLSDGPLQPGNYTLSVSSLTDRTGNVLVPYSQSFTVAGVSPYTLQGRSNTSLANATPLVTPTSQPDGSFSNTNSYSVSGSTPYYTVSARLRGPSFPLDLVTANFSSGTITVLLGNGNGTFQNPVTYNVGSEPIALAVGDLNGDGKLDIAVANYGSATVSVVFGNGDGTFQNAVNYNVGSNPRGVAIADLDGKNGNDLVVANWSSGNVSVLLNKGNGTFNNAVNYAVGSNPGNVLVADVNGDGKLDIVTPNNGSNSVSVLPGNGDGTFGSQVTFATGASTSPIDVVAVDLNGDGKLDLATANNGSGTVSVLLNQGTLGATLSAATFAAATSYSTGASYSFHLVAADLNGDGKADLAVANYPNNTVSVLPGNGDGTFQAATTYSVSNNPISITAGDFNGDGITDLATGNYNGGNVTLLLGNASKPLPVDSTTGLMSGYGRGALLTSSTDTFFSWTGKAGDSVYVAAQTLGSPSASGLSYFVLNANGSNLGSFSTSFNGQGQGSPITLPYSGTYYVEIGPDYSYTGEYRFRMTEAPPSVQLATTYNGSVSSANTPTLANTSAGNLTGTEAGYIGLADPNGDYFNLGNVLAATTLNVTETQPANSALSGVLNIYNASGTNLTNNTTVTSSLSYTVPTGQGGDYFARVSAVSGTADLLSQYVLSIDVVNTTPPQVSASTLPAQGATSTAVIDNFALTFSESMAAATVNNTANYTLKDAQGNVYHLSEPHLHQRA